MTCALPLLITLTPLTSNLWRVSIVKVNLTILLTKLRQDLPNLRMNTNSIMQIIQSFVKVKSYNS